MTNSNGNEEASNTAPRINNPINKPTPPSPEPPEDREDEYFLVRFGGEPSVRLRRFT